MASVLDSDEPEASKQTAGELVSDVEMYWVSDHFDELIEQYGGDWIAVVGERVVAHAPTTPELREMLDSMGIMSIFLEKIPRKDNMSSFIMSK